MTHGRCLPGLALLCLLANSTSAAPITFNSALPVAKGEFINRELLILIRSDDATRDLNVNALASVLATA